MPGTLHSSDLNSQKPIQIGVWMYDRTTGNAFKVLEVDEQTVKIVDLVLTGAPLKPRVVNRLILESDIAKRSVFVSTLR